jgi:putative protein kinase ArgK-like GTPase of G3E family
VFLDGYFGKRRGRKTAEQPRVFIISALTGEGCKELTFAIADFLAQFAEAEVEAAEHAAASE